MSMGYLGREWVDQAMSRSLDHEWVDLTKNVTESYSK